MKSVKTEISQSINKECNEIRKKIKALEEDCARYSKELNTEKYLEANRLLNLYKMRLERRLQKPKDVVGESYILPMR